MFKSFKLMTPIVWLTRLLVGAYPHWQGCAPSSKQRIYFANHTSHLDTIVIWASLCSHELLISMAAIGLGVACVTREFAVSALADGSIRELRTVPEIPERSLSVCALQEVTPCPAAERFLEFWA